MSVNHEPNVLLFLGSGFEDLEAVAVLDVCGWTEYRDHIPRVRVTTTGFHDEVRGRFGLVIRPDVPFTNVVADDYDAIALPGGFRSHGYDEVYDRRLYTLLRELDTIGKTIATMCVGVLPVAEAGLLEGKRATTYPYSRHDNRVQLAAAGAIVVDEPLVVDEHLISCAGPAHAVDVALLLIDALIGPEARAEVSKHMVNEGKT